jgi:hypothetical protein
VENDEIGRRRRIIASRLTDMDRWANPSQLEPTWEARAIFAKDFITAGAKVMDIGCGAMKLERHLPFGCSYVPCDLVARDDRTVVADLNETGIPEKHVTEADLIVMLGVWEYLYKPDEIFSAFAKTGKPILCSYCARELTAHLDRGALGWVNDFSLPEFLELARSNGYRLAVQKQIDSLQYLFKFVCSSDSPAPTRKRVHVISYNNVGNFGDRLGFHMLNDVLPPHSEVSWGNFRPFTTVPEGLDLLVVGIGNSLFGDLIDDQLIQSTKKARASIGIFGTQYHPLLPRNRLTNLLDSLTHWFARYEEDIQLYGRGRSNVSHLGDWLINAFPLAMATDDKVLNIGKEIWNDLPLDRTIQFIQRHRRVFSERVHPLLCALTSANEVAYKEQRESGNPAVSSGKFRSMLIDIFDQTFSENVVWRVDRDKVAVYKEQVRRRTDELRSYLSEALA